MIGTVRSGMSLQAGIGVAKVFIRRMIEILHDFIYPNPRNCGKEVYMMSCRIYVINSMGSWYGGLIRTPIPTKNRKGPVTSARRNTLRWAAQKGGLEGRALKGLHSRALRFLEMGPKLVLGWYK